MGGGGGHNVNKILTWHPTVPACTTTIGKPQGHNGSGTTLLMPPSPLGVIFLPRGLKNWCLTYVLQNMSKHYPFGGTSSVPPLQRGTFHA